MTKARNLANFVAITGDLTVADKVVHEGDTNTAIRFPAADVVTIETAGLERVRVTDIGRVGIGTDTPETNLQVVNPSAIGIIEVKGSGEAHLTALNSTGTNQYAFLGTYGGPSGTHYLWGSGVYDFTFHTNDTERARIGADGTFSFNSAIKEKVHTLTGTTPALDPLNGTIQTWTLSGNSSPTDSILAGEAMTLMIDDGSAFTITWPSVTWKTDGGNAPTLNTTGFTAVILWKVGTTLYGARVGDA